jgi:hypothetical protein
MEFFIKKNATLPLLKMQIVNDGKGDIRSFMERIELSTIYFSMVNVDTGISKVLNKEAGFVEKTFIEPNAEPEYYVYYRFTSTDTNKVGRYEGQFLMKCDDGNLIFPIREPLYINISESYSSIDLTYTTNYSSNGLIC